jgi:hypothetical protein
MLHFIGRTPGPSRVRTAEFYVRRMTDASLVDFGLFLKDRDLGFLLFFPEILTEEEHRAQRQNRQEKFKEAFHRNLPFLILWKCREKSIGCNFDTAPI